MTTVTLTAPTLHSTQQDVYDSPARFRVLVAGRRWGKSKLAALECIRVLMAGGAVWWVAPTFDLSKRVGWKTMTTMLDPILTGNYGATVNKSDLLITLPNGGYFQCKSADHPERLVGEGLDAVIIDECGIVHPDTWFESLRPALSDRLGRALFIGTPKGKNWFWQIYQRGLDPLEPSWESWRKPSIDNPFLPPGEVEDAKQDLPELTFEQEYEAVFTDDGGAVFRGVTKCTQEPPRESGNVVFGVDWGRHNDYTVIVALDRNTNRMLEIDRFNQINWSLQRGRLSAMSKRWEPRLILAEANSIGEPNIEILKSEGLPIEGFQTTASSKPPLIDALALAIENQEIGLLDDPVLISELQAYEMERLPSGSFRYNAPEGGHDDTVIATALAWWAVIYRQPLEVTTTSWQ